MTAVRSFSFGLYNAAMDVLRRTGVGLFSLPDWVGWTFGGLFIAMGVLVLCFTPRANARAKAFKAKQLAAYNELYHKHEADYAKTGMYLPLWERAKQLLPLIAGVTLIIVGIAWIVGNTLTTL